MRVYFENVDALREGIALVAEDLDLTLCDKADAELTVSVIESRERIVEVVLDGKTASITYFPIFLLLTALVFTTEKTG